MKKVKNPRKEVFDMGSPDYIFKVCLFANKDVGKKTFAKSDFLYNPMILDHMTTRGIEFASKTVEVYGKHIRTAFWICSSKVRFQIRWNSIFNGSLGIILMYDITNEKSLNWLSEWCQMAKNYREDISILLVGNKLDLEEHREVSKEDVEKFKEKHEISSSIEISLKTGENVEEMFRKLTITIIKKWFSDIEIEKKDRKKKRKEKRKRRKLSRVQV